MKEGLTVLKDTVYNDRKGQQQVLEVGGHTASTVRTKRQTDACVQPQMTPAHEVVSPALRVNLPLSIKLI